MEQVAAEGGDWPAADQDFHMSIIRASHNEYMRRLYPIINSAVSEILQISQNRKHMQEIAVNDNRMILEFLLQRDEAGAPPRHEHPHAPSDAHAAGLRYGTGRLPAVKKSRQTGLHTRAVWIFL
jgi:hypothetical protein